MNRKNRQPRTLLNLRGAGRPPGRVASYIPHLPRPLFKKGIPLHITLKRSKHYPNLRSKMFLKIIKRALICARRKGVFISAYTLQSNHIHLLVETGDKTTLMKGMKAFTAMIIYSMKQLQLLKDKQPFFSDRYHLSLKKTPTEIRRALSYIISNTHKHQRKIVKAFSCPYTFLFSPRFFLTQMAYTALQIPYK